MKAITIHSSATPPSMHISATEIRQWHKARGWRDIGYHWVIKRDGTLEQGRPMSQTGAHVKGHNRNNIGICLIGGVNKSHHPENNFTNAQWLTLNTTLTLLCNQYQIPKSKIQGHNTLTPNTACPSFNVAEYLSFSLAP
ncbi:N-acetylmuramoyl-L-alanine amidase [Vibrio astriarenae]